MNLTVEAGHTKTLTCCHVKKSVFSNDLLQKVQKAFDDLKRSETSSQGNQTLITKFSTVAGSNPQERGSGCSSEDKTSNTTMQRTMPVDHEVSVITCSELEVDQGTEVSSARTLRRPIGEAEGSARTSEAYDIKKSEDPEEGEYIDAEEREKMELDDELLLRAATQVEDSNNQEKKKQKGKRKGSRQVSSLAYAQHPGVQTGKRQRRKR